MRTTRVKIVTAAATLAIAGAGTLGVVSAAAQAPSPSVPAGATTTSTHLTVDAAIDAAQAALDAAEKEGQRVTVAVVDRNGNTVVTLRGDGAGPQSYESAIAKAYTAVSWHAPTSELVNRLQATPNLKDIPNTLFLPGGVPVTSGNAPVAGIGVAGAPSGDLDEKFARAGVTELTRGR